MMGFVRRLCVYAVVHCWLYVSGLCVSHLTLQIFFLDYCFLPYFLPCVQFQLATYSCFLPAELYSLCGGRKGKSACGKKKRQPPLGVTAAVAWQRSEPSKTPKRSLAKRQVLCQGQGGTKAAASTTGWGGQ